MADNPYVNKVEYGGQTLVDLTGDTATAADVVQGKTFHLASGAQATGEADYAPQAQISGVFSASETYAIGDYVVENGLLYRCTTPHSGAWDASHFEQVTIGGELNTRTPVYGKGVNLLDNAYFIGGGTPGKFPVNQKGATSYNATGAICIDRWVLNQNTLSLTAAGLKANTGSSINLIQYFEDERIDDGQTYILSVLFDNGLVQGTGLLSKSQQSGSSWQISTLNTVSGVWVGIRYDTGSSKWHLRLSCENDTRTIIAVKLELGSMQTLARQVNGSWVLNDPPPNYQQELAKCQYHMFVVGSNWIVLRASKVYSTANTGECIFYLPLPVIPKGNPKLATLQAAFGSTIVLHDLAWKAQTGFSLTDANATSGGVTLRFGKNNHGLTDASLQITRGTVFDFD